MKERQSASIPNFFFSLLFFSLYKTQTMLILLATNLEDNLGHYSCRICKVAFALTTSEISIKFLTTPTEGKISAFFVLSSSSYHYRPLMLKVLLGLSLDHTFIGVEPL